MTRIRTVPLAGILLLASVGVCAAQSGDPKDGKPITPVPLPATFNVPTPGYVIDQWVSTGNTSRMRGHAWDIWMSMAQPSGQAYPVVNGSTGQLPVWDTWNSDNELFNTSVDTTVTTPTATQYGSTDAKRVMHPFHLARQQIHEAGPNPQASNDVAISFNKFDPTAAAFILTPQATPFSEGVTFAINAQAEVAELNATWPADTPVGRRAIIDFPRSALETKPVFLPVLADRLTPIPLWQGAAQSSNHKNPTPTTWTTCVLVDASKTAASDNQISPATDAQIANAAIPTNYNCDKSKFLYAPIALFYAVRLDDAGAESFTALQGTTASRGLTVKAGDYAVLTAMHVNTKEIDRWTWQTFYWQGSSQFDVGHPGSLGDVPAALAAPWSSYAMCTAYDQVIAGQRVTCFNPYLETAAGIPDGINSNCVSCHGMASIGGSPTSPTTGIYPPIYTDNNVFKIPVDFSDELLFGGRTKVDFSWAVGGGG